MIPVESEEINLSLSRDCWEQESIEGDLSPPPKMLGVMDDSLFNDQDVDVSGDSFTSVEAKNIRKMVKSRGSIRSVVDGNKESPVDKPPGTTAKNNSRNSDDDSASCSSSGGSLCASKHRSKAAVEEEKILASLPSELQDLFSSIGEYKPCKLDIKTELKCFIPPYIPAVGSVDQFCKIPRPDGIKDNLGISVIDEPSMRQSDAAVLELRLHAQMKKRTRGSIVRSIDGAANNPQEINVWIESTEDVHRSRPAPEVVYNHPMPDMDELIMGPSSSSQTSSSSLLPEELRNALDQEKGEFREALNPNLSLSLTNYAKILCFLLDIPVREGGGNLVQSLHYLFTLYYEYQGRDGTASDIHTDAVSVL